MARMTPSIAKTSLGLQKNGQLSRCPGMPNCVCTAHKDDKAHMAAPLTFTGSPEAAKACLQEVLAKQAGYKIVEEKDHYLRVEVVSGIFKFVDDVEFHFQPAMKEIHFRSASRLGYWDIGANRKRMKKLKQLFEAAGV